MAKKNINAIKKAKSDYVLEWITGIILVVLIIVIAYPIIYVISASVSSSAALESGLVVFWPVDFSLEAYEFVFRFQQVWVGFRNSIFYTICDLLIQMTMTLFVAYPISRGYFGPRKFYTFIFFFSTRVSAGLIPTFILKCNLGLFDNIWAVIIGSSVSVAHVLILRTAITSNVSNDLFDAARIDGANHFQSIFNVVLPLTKATLAVLMFYTICGQWNEYFNSMLYLRDSRLYPLQLVLRPIMTAATAQAGIQAGSVSSSEAEGDGLENVRYALIIITSTPMIALFFAVQKFFKGGVMMGSLKG